jgi:hypothetical protein
MKTASKEWENVNTRIHKCLRKAAAERLKQGHIVQDEYDDFFISGSSVNLYLTIHL